MAGNLELLVQRTKEDEQKLRKLDLRLLQEPVSYTHLDVYKRQGIRRSEKYWPF